MTDDDLTAIDEIDCYTFTHDQIRALVAEVRRLREVNENRRVERELVRRAGYGWVYGLDLVTSPIRISEACAPLRAALARLP